MSFEYINGSLKVTGSYGSLDGNVAIETANLDDSGSGSGFVMYKIRSPKNQISPEVNKRKMQMRHKRQPRQQINVEVLAVVDYAIYKRWYEISTTGTETEKQADAIDNIKYYFSQVFNDVDTRYGSIDTGDFAYSVFLSGLHIHTTASSSSHIENLVESDGKIDADTLLGESLRIHTL